MRGRQTGGLSQRADSTMEKTRCLRKTCGAIITGATKPHNLIWGCEGRVEDIYQRDTGHNALCLIG